MSILAGTMLHHAQLTKLCDWALDVSGVVMIVAMTVTKVILAMLVEVVV